VPTYQYACTECGHDFETVQSFTDAALTDCPQCTGRLRKVFNSVGVVFKGSGFYRTDSREPAKAASNGEKGGEKSADKPGDKKPAEPKGTKAEGTGGSTSPAKAPAASGSSTAGSAA
jgi:putative FmdB family regulatory protein